MTRQPLTHDAARELMLDLVRGRLPVSDTTALDTHLEQCETCRTELADLQAIWSELGKLPDVAPSPAMRTRFRAVLAAYEEGRQANRVEGWKEGLDRFLGMMWPSRPVTQLGVALAMLVVGLGLGSLRGSGDTSSSLEVAQLRGEMQAISRMLAVSLLQQGSASERLKGVSMSAQFNSSDEEVTAALLEALKFDPNVNVRLAALDALVGNRHSDAVKKELLTWLPRQSSPLVQLEMVSYLSVQPDAQVKAALSNLLGRKDLDRAVRERISSVLGTLS